jgi:phage terminase large subunit-like protein
MCALQYVDVPGYAALLLRRVYPQLIRSDGLIPRSQEWLAGTDAKWNAEHKFWTFPSGARVEFGHLQHTGDIYNYQGPAYQFVGFDELTQFLELMYKYLFSRQRRPVDPSDPLSRVPLRSRSAGNPGGIGHEWVKNRFNIPDDKGVCHNPGRPFIPAKLTDNPHLDHDSYIEGLKELDPITREQLLNGDWSARHLGGMFKREWFGETMPWGPPLEEMKVCRFWDLAHTAPKPNIDPDWTVGCKLGLHSGLWWILDIQRIRGNPNDVEALVARTAEMDGPRVRIRMEQEPAGGKALVEHYARNILLGRDFKGIPAGSADPAVRWGPISAAAEGRRVRLVEGPWVTDFFEEIEVAPFGTHDDQLTAWAGAHRDLALGGQEARLY